MKKQMKKPQLIKEAQRFQKLAGIIKENEEFEGADDSIKQLAHKYYNKWMKEETPWGNFGDSTTFSGSEDDIINGNYIEDNQFPNVTGFEIEEVASIYITNDSSMVSKLKNLGGGPDYTKMYKEGDYFIIILE